MKQKVKHDDGLGWLREIRENIARECDHDPRKLGDMYRKIYAEEMERRSSRTAVLREEKKA